MLATNKPLKQVDPQTFFSKAAIGNDCWEWQGSMYQNGYGKLGKVGIMAHRIAYELCVDDIPEGMFVDHTCHNKDKSCLDVKTCKHRRCINPEHLEVVTTKENLLRGNTINARNAAKTHCDHGHEFTPSNTYVHPKRESRLCRACRAVNVKKYQLKNSLTG